MKRNSGLQKRWLRNTLSILFAIVLLCVIALSIMVAAYYYSSMEAGMEAKARTSTSFFDNYVRQSYNEYYQSCAKFAQSFDSKDQMELQFVNTNNRIVASSYGVYSGMAGADVRHPRGHRDEGHRVLHRTQIPRPVSASWPCPARSSIQTARSSACCAMSRACAAPTGRSCSSA